MEKKYSSTKQFIMVIVAILSVATAINLFVLSGFGGDPLTVFQEGIHKTMNISLGQATWLYNLIMFGICLLFARKNLGVGTLIYMFSLGVAIDVIEIYLILITEVFETLEGRIIACIIGQLLLSLGFALLIASKKGSSTIDSISFKLATITKTHYNIIRTIFDGCFVFIGIILGGVFGIGTVFSVLTTGIMTNRIAKKLEAKGTIII